MTQNPCPECTSDRVSLEDACPSCGWRPTEIRTEGEGLGHERVSLPPSNAMRFSLRRMLGFVTLGCIGFGAAISAAGPQFEDTLRSFLATVLAVQCATALYAACDPLLGHPITLDIQPIRTGHVTLTLATIVSVLFLLLGGLGSMIFVENNLTMDAGGASFQEWLDGSGLIVATCIGSFARGAALVGFMALLFGAPLRRGWAAIFGLAGGSLVALLVWRLTGDVRGVMAGVVSLLLLLAGCSLAMGAVWRGGMFGRRSRRWGARGYLVGLATGLASAFVPIIEWLLFWKPPMSLLLGATIGSGLGAIIGMLSGVSRKKDQSL